VIDLRDADLWIWLAVMGLFAAIIAGAAWWACLRPPTADDMPDEVNGPGDRWGQGW
jgi:hypothetical protein